MELSGRRAACEVVRQIHTRGGVIVAGTDDKLPGPALIDEIGLLTGCGLTPMSALQAATQRAAAALRLPDAGTIEAGKVADLVILDADPLADPAHLRKTWRVVKGGYVHDPAALLAPVVADYRAALRLAWAARIVTASSALIVGGGLAGYWRRRNSRRGRDVVLAGS